MDEGYTEPEIALLRSGGERWMEEARRWLDGLRPDAASAPPPIGLNLMAWLDEAAVHFDESVERLTRGETVPRPGYGMWNVDALADRLTRPARDQPDTFALQASWAHLDDEGAAWLRANAARGSGFVCSRVPHLDDAENGGEPDSVHDLFVAARQRGAHWLIVWESGGPLLRKVPTYR